MRVRLWHPINIRDVALANYPLGVIAKSHICGIFYPSTYRLSGGKTQPKRSYEDYESSTDDRR